MSRTIDEKVVEMRFDNRQFEDGVQTSLTTLDKLKKSLKLEDAAKGFKDIDKAAKNVNISSLSLGLEKVQKSLDSLNTKASVTYQRWMNRIQSMGERLVKSLSVDQITQGWSKYEEITGNVQTIMNSTGLSMDKVYDKLKLLSRFSDETSYSLKDMTTALADGVSKGADIDKLIPMITGIAEATAYAGKGSNEFSRAIYNLMQSYSTGSLQLIDWKSVTMAGAQSQKLIQTLIDAGEELGTITKGQVTLANFQDSLKDKWATSAVMEKAYGRWSALILEAINEVDAGKFKNLADAIDALSSSYEDFVSDATDASFSAKTFQEAIDATKDAVSTGWATTFQTIIGNYEEAKELWTGVVEWLWEVFAAGASIRNKILDLALTKHLINIGEILDDILSPIKDVTDAVSNATTTLEALDAIATKVIRGDFGAGVDRVKRLTNAGYDYAEVQTKVNSLLGIQTKVSSKVATATGKLAENAKDAAENQNEAASAERELTDEDKEKLKTLLSLNEVYLKNVGYSKEQIEALRSIKQMATDLNIPIDEFVDNMDKINGRWLLVDSLKTVGDSILNILTAVKDAWHEVFYGTTDEDAIIEKRAEIILNVVKAIHSFTKKLAVTEDGVSKFTRVFRGFLNIFKIAGLVIGGPVRVAFTLVSEVLRLLNIDILDVVASIGDWVTKAEEWIRSNVDLSIAVEWVKEKVSLVIEKLREWYNIGKTWIDQNTNLSNGFEILKTNIEDGVKSFKEWVNELKTAENKPKKFLEGISNFGLNVKKFFQQLFTKDAVVDPKESIQAMASIVIEGQKNVLDYLREFALGILSKLGITEESIAAGKEFIDGFVKGIKENEIVQAIQSTVDSLLKSINLNPGKIDVGQIAAGGFTAGLLIMFKKVTEAIEAFAKPLNTLFGIISNIGNVFTNLNGLIGQGTKTLATFQGNIRANTLKTIAISIAILAGAIIGLAIAMTKYDVLPALGILALVAGGLIAFMAALAFISKQMKSADSLLGLGNDKKIDTSLAQIALLVIAIGASLLLLAVALKTVAKIDDKDIGKAIVLMILFGALVVTITSVGSVAKTTDVSKIAGIILAVGGCMVILARVAKSISGMSWEALGKAAVGMIFLELIVAGLIAVSQSGYGVSTSGKTILGIAVAMLLLVGVAKAINTMDWDALGKAAVGIGYLTIILAVLMTVANTGTGDVGKLGAAMAGIGMGMVLMMAAAKIIVSMSWAELGKAAVGLGVLAGFIAGLIYICKFSQQGDLKGLPLTLITISISIVLLAGVMAALSLLSWEQLGKGLAAITVLGLIMMGIVTVAKNADKAKSSVVALGVVIGIMAIALIALSNVPEDGLIRATACLGSLMAIFAGILAASKLASDSMKSILVIGAVLGGLAVILYLLSLLPVQDIEKQTAFMYSLGGMIVALSIAMAFLGAIPEKSFNSIMKLMKPLAIMVVLCAAIGLIFAMMSALHAENVIENAAAISILLTVMTACLIPLSYFVKDIKVVLAGAAALGLMTVVLGLLGMVLVMMSVLPVENAMEHVLALSILLVMITGVMAVLALLGAAFPTIGPGILGLALLAGVLALLGLVLAMMDGMHVVNALVNTKALCTLLEALVEAAVVMGVVGWLATGIILGSVGLAALVGVMYLVAEVIRSMQDMDMVAAAESALFMSKLLNTLVTACTILAIVGPLALVGDVAVGGLLALISSFALVATALGALMSIPGLEDFLDKGIDIFNKLAFGLGSIVGSLLAGFAASSAAALPIYGLALSSFMIAASPFIDKIAKVGPDVAAGAGYLFDAITKLSIAEIINSLASFIGGGLVELGTELSAFMFAATGFIVGSRLIKPELGTTMEALASAVMALTATGVVDGIARLFGFGSSSPLSSLGDELKNFGPKLKDFSDSVKDVNIYAVSKSATAIRDLADAADKLPSTGGDWQSFWGSKDFTAFSDGFKNLGTALAAYSNSVKTGVDVQAIQDSIPAVDGLIELTNKLSNSGGTWQTFWGEKDLRKFSGQLSQFGWAIKAYSMTITSDKGIDAEAIKNSAGAAQSVVDMTNTLSNTGGTWQDIFGEKNLGAFGDDLKTFGEHLVNYSASVSNINKPAIDRSANIVERFVGLLNTIIVSTDPLQLSSLGSNIVQLADYLSQYLNTVKDFNYANFYSSIYAYDALIDLIESCNATNFDGMASLSSTLKLVGDEGFNSFVDAFKDTTEVTNAVSAIVRVLVEGFQNGVPTIKYSITRLANECLSQLNFSYTSFYNAGKYLGTGLINGINAKQIDVRNAAYNLGRVAVQGEMDGQDSNSPSKAMIQAGKFLGDGLIIGMQQMMHAVYSSGSDIGESAVSSISSALSKIDSISESDIDLQPTIRPVLDLSDVESGAGKIGSLLNGDASVYATSNIGAVSAAMRNQNGGNADVVSAIEDLRNTIGTQTGNTYNINGINYSEDSDVADALKVIVRAARVERRS